MKKSDVLIKWTGSKRFQAEEIVKHFPRQINRYLEPFAGGCSVLWEVLNTPDIKVKYYICSDVNPDLIALWKEIKEHPYRITFDYKQLWQNLNNIQNEKERNACWYELRNDFNKHRDPSMFLFLNRTCYNGLIRYNNTGEFNTSYHFSRKGVDPKTLQDVVFRWHKVLTEKNVIFNEENYIDVIAGYDDFMYCDPPYSKSDTMYYGKIDYDELFAYLDYIKCKWVLSFDGLQNDVSNVYDIPKELYKKHLLLEAGSSSFSKLKGNDVAVKESIYLNF